MSNSKDNGPSGFSRRLQKLIELSRPVNKGELSEEARREIRLEDDKWEKEKPLYRGGDPNRMQDGDNTKTGDADLDNVDRRVKRNTQTTRENKKLLSVIDERTSILMRLIFAILLALVVGISVGVTVQLIV